MVLKIGLTNVTGRMGIAMLDAVKTNSDIEISAGLSRKKQTSYQFDITQSVSDLLEKSDIVIDFALPTVTSALLYENITTKKPLVVASTGHSDKEKTLLREAAKVAPIVQEYNMSLGINLLFNLLPLMLNALGPEFNIDLTDKHHRHKVDAPSGATRKILDIVQAHINTSKPDLIYNQNFKDGPRESDTVGVSVTRAGNIFGEHEISFTSDNEKINLSHTSLNREVFAHGALKAAEWIQNKPAGLYSMSDVLNLK